MNAPASRIDKRPKALALRCSVGVAMLALLGSACGDDKSNSDKLAEELIKSAQSAAANEAANGDSPGLTAPGASDAAGDNNNSNSSSNNSNQSQQPGDGTVAPPVTVKVGKSVWFDGFKVTVNSAERSSNALSGTINLDISFENNTDEVRRLDARALVLSVGTQSYLAGIAGTPEVPARSRNDQVLDFLVDDTFVLDNATLTFGDPTQNQAIMPLGSGDPTTFEPKALQVDATVTTPLESIHLTGGSIDASYAPAEKGVYIVRVPLQATYTGGSAGGDLLLPAQFALKSPAGVSVVGVPIAPGDVVAEPVYPNQDVKGLAIAFKVASPDSGTWTITYTDSAGATNSANFTVG